MNKKLKRLSIELSKLNSGFKNLSSVKKDIDNYKTLINELNKYLPKLSNNKGRIGILFSYNGGSGQVAGSMYITRDSKGKLNINYHYDGNGDDSYSGDYSFERDKDLLNYIDDEVSYHKATSKGSLDEFLFEFNDNI